MISQVNGIFEMHESRLSWKYTVKNENFYVQGILIQKDKDKESNLF